MSDRGRRATGVVAAGKQRDARPHVQKIHDRQEPASWAAPTA